MSVNVIRIVLLLLAALACSPAQGQQPLSYAPERLALPSAVDDLVQCNIQVAPEALLQAHAKYCQAYADLFSQLDSQEERASAGPDARVGILPTTKATQLAIQQRKQSVAVAAQMLDAFLDDLARSVAPEQQSAFDAYRDECHIRLLAQRMESDSGAVTRTEAPFDLGGWLRVAATEGDQNAAARAQFAAARTANHAQRRIAMLALLQDVEEARLRAARVADELGIGGQTEGEVRQAANDHGDPRGWEAIDKVTKAAQLDPAARARMVTVELEAWRLAAPQLSRPARWYAAGTVVQVLAGSRGDLGRALNVPVSVDKSLYAGGFSVIRTALSLPDLTDAQRAQARELGVQWLDARTLLLEKAAVAACSPQFSGTPDGAELVKLDTDSRAKLAQITGAKWLEVAPGDNGYMQYQESRTGLPARDQLKLLPEDDAMFALPRGGRSWYASSRPENDQRQERMNGRIIAPAAESESRMSLAVGLSSEQDAIVQSLWADFRHTWSTKVKAAIDQADTAARATQSLRMNGNTPKALQQHFEAYRVAAREAIRLDDAAWSTAGAALQEFADAVAAAIPGDAGAAARTWIESRRVDMGMAPSGWELSMTNLAAAPFNPWMSQAGSRQAAAALASGAPALSDAFHRVRIAVGHTNDRQLAGMLQVVGFSPEEGQANLAVKKQSLAAVRREYLQRVDTELARVSALLGAQDAASLRRAVNMQRYGYAFITLREAIEALPDTPANQEARAAVQAENNGLMEACDRGFQIALGLPECDALFSEMHGPITQVHARTQVYVNLARDLRSHALWRLRAKMPPEVLERVGLFRQVDAIAAVAGER